MVNICLLSPYSVFLCICFLYKYECLRLLSEVAFEGNETILTASYLLLYVMTTGLKPLVQNMMRQINIFYVDNTGVFHIIGFSCPHFG